MPQMAPMNWMILFIMFIMIFLMYNMINYFNFKYKIKNLSFNKTFIKNNWKW
uniref:ATP synthase complex subunit 8 n=1 Tax=Nosodendron sp. BMNH 840466 TaxID=904170 RepID=A0A343A469_9COLE|nr:ATP synthase F0 subunit 8 [Nosodendron sp. BMNH 840466]